jgi:rhomboid protease GluP
MIRLREGDQERLISIDEFEARARSGEMSPFVWVCIPTLTGDRFVQARDLPLFVALYDPRRLHFRQHFSVGRLPLVTGLLAVGAVVLYFLTQHLGEGIVTRDALLVLGAKARARILEDGEAWRLLSANLLHRDAVHLAFNLFALLNVGTVLEGVYRRGDYVLLLMVCGLGTMLTSAFLSGPVTVGASGLVFGCLGAAVVFGWRYGDVLPVRYRLYFGVVVVGYAAIMLYLGLRSANTDNWGHAGGMLAGLFMGGMLVPRLLRLTDQPREPRASLLRPWLMSAGLVAAVFALGPILPALFLRFEPYPVESFGVVLERPSHWTKAADPLGFLTFGNGVDAFASLGCAERPEPPTLDEAARLFAEQELAGLARGGHIGNLSVSPASRSTVGRGEAEREAALVRFSFMASDGPLDARALLFTRGALECALVLAARPSAPGSSELRLEEIRARLRFEKTRGQELARREVLGRPSSASKWLDLALAHQRAGDLDEARSALAEAARFAGEDSRLVGRVTFARARLELHFARDAAAAVPFAEHATTLVGGERDATLLLLDALLEAGELARARDHLVAARARLGEDPAVEERSARLAALAALPGEIVQ